MKEIEKLSYEAMVKWSSSPRSRTYERNTRDDDFEAGFQAGFRKAREMAMANVSRAKDLSDHFGSNPSIGPNLKREHEFLSEQLKILVGVFEQLGESDIE